MTTIFPHRRDRLAGFRQIARLVRELLPCNGLARRQGAPLPDDLQADLGLPAPAAMPRFANLPLPRMD